jgi:hypothetical protein
MSIVELVDPFSEDSGPVRTGNVEARGTFNIGFVFSGALRKGNLIVLNVALQSLNLGSKPDGLSVVGLLGLVDSANSSTQYSLESGGIKVGDVPKESVQ